MLLNVRRSSNGWAANWASFCLNRPVTLATKPFGKILPRLEVERAWARARRPGPKISRLGRAFLLAREPKNDQI